MNTPDHSTFMSEALTEALKGIKAGDGGPFGAVIVHQGQIIARAHNEVLKTHDPTAHAEVLAIRRASAYLKRFDLSDCEIYTTCEPCPMCYAAVHWAKMETLYYGCTREDAAAIGFDDAYIYEVIQGTAKVQQVSLTQIGHQACMTAFEAWTMKQDRTQY
ncbi:nucleoside deaminase [Eisenibacter elegans]|jgi:guanine deaminase|uniref:nucleoside deaminase n=1 Tax=Eisenibacter elegans TaxID=997 RepID=UPI0004203A90|nr:nucleoside deaminase [Eisenibacter elegans]